MSHGRLGSYEILERIGEGGMGVVFRARDPRLGREVALKVLREDLARDEQCRTRLLREARAEARLSHENIAICFDVGEAKPDPADLFSPGAPGPHPESVLYIAMEFVPGSNLDELITARPMPLRRVIELALQMAAGLEAAHAAGVIHRDLKPGNVRVTPEGRAKILDFGLARVCRPEGADSSTSTISVRSSSSTGQIVGTPLYMSPEQASGGALDARSDLFSFGLVLYELVTGQRPFGGVDAISAMYALANEQPPPLARYSRNVPEELQRIVDKLLAKHPQDRYQSAHEVRTDLRRVYESLSGSSLPRPRPVGPTLRKRDFGAAAVSVLAVAAGAMIWLRAHPVPAVPQSLAVLGFENMTSDSTLEYLSAGLAFDVVSDLVNYARLNVAPPSEVAKLSTDQLTPQGAARELGVPTVLTGAIRRLGQVTRLEVQLVDGRTGFPRWSAAYEIDATEAYRVKREIVGSVASRLGAGPVIEAVSPAAAPPAEAYERYLRGIEAMSDINDPLAPRRSAALLLEAVTLAPSYAAGWAARARALAWRYDHEHLPALLEEAERCANEALRLEPDLVQGRVSRARIYRVTGRRKEAIADLDAALKINPNWDDVWVTLGALYRQTGDFERAEAAYRRAVELRPESDRNWSQLGNFFVVAGHYADARAAYRRVIELRPDLNRGYEAMAAAYLSEGRFRDAIALYEKLPRGVTSAPIASNIATAYFMVGRLDEALRNYLLSVSLEPRAAALRGNLGDCYLRMRRAEEARSQYREAVRLNEADLRVSSDDPALQAQYIMHLAKAGECAASAAAYRSHRTMLSDKDAEIQHMLARAFALCGRDGEAVAALGKMVALGASADLFRSEDEFIPLRADSAFRALVNGSAR